MRKHITQEQVVAIKKERQMAYSLLDLYGKDIVELRRQGYEQEEIARYYLHLFPASDLKIATLAIHFILERMLPERERIRIAEQNRKDSASRTGDRMYDEEGGCFSLSEEELEAARGKGGQETYERGNGIFAMSEKARERRNKKVRDMDYESLEQKTGLFGMSRRERIEAAIKATQAAGHILWTEDELADLIQLSQNPEYLHTKPSCYGKPNLYRITQKLNRVYHNNCPIRTKSSVFRKLCKLRINKSLADKL
jgi:hypothetical protein